MDERDISFLGSEDNLKSLLAEIGNVPVEDDRISVLAQFLIENAQKKTVKTETAPFQSNVNTELEEIAGIPVALHVRNTPYHIPIKKWLLDFLVGVSISYVTTGNIELSVILSSLWNAKDILIKIPPRCHCIYLKIYYYGMTHGFLPDDLWDKCQTDECDYRTKLFRCPYNENDSCSLTRVLFDKRISELEHKGIIVPNEDEDGKYQIQN